MRCIALSSPYIHMSVSTILSVGTSLVPILHQVYNLKQSFGAHEFRSGDAPIINVRISIVLHDNGQKWSAMQWNMCAADLARCPNIIDSSCAGAHARRHATGC